MAAFDIMPFRSPHGQMGKIEHFRLNAAESFVVGEPVSVNADGELTESADDPVDADLMGIALAPGGASGAASLNWRTNAAYTTGDRIPVAIPESSSLYITRNFSAAGTAFNDTAPALADIGDEVGLSLISGVWGVDQSATNNTCRIVDILNARKTSIQETGETLNTTLVGGVAQYWVVFQIVAHQSISLGTADAPVA